MARGFPGGPVVKNLPSNAGDMASIPGWGTKIPHDAGQLSPRTATSEPMPSRARTPQLERSPQAATKSLHATTKTQRSQINLKIQKKKKNTPPFKKMNNQMAIFM